MHCSKQELLDALDRMRQLSALVIGDLMLDRYIWGDVARISPEAPVPVVNVLKSEERLGGAGNSVSNLVNLGVKVTLCGFVGDDDEGQVALRLLEDAEVTKDGVLIDRDRPTVMKMRVIARNQQVVRIDRELKEAPRAALMEGFAAMVDSQLSSADVVLISDYGKGTVTARVMEKLKQARLDGRVAISVNNRPVFLDPHPDNYPIYHSITGAKPNRSEAELAYGKRISSREDAFSAAKVLIDRWQTDMIVISLGEDGLVVVSADGQQLGLETTAREVYDVSGAGDTVSSVFAAAMASGSSLLVAGELANMAAGVVVSEVGTVAITHQQLVEEIERRA